MHMQDELQRIIAFDAFGTDPDIVREAPMRPKSIELQTWPSGVTSIDNLTGGFYGAALIGGKQKVGKSMMAIRSSILAAQSGWTVAYFDAENDRDEVMRRAWNVIGAKENDSLTFWHPWFVRRAATLERIAECAAQTIVPGDKRLLIVIDSLNRVAKRMERNDKRYQRGGGYFRALQDVCEWAQAATMLSNGRVGVLLTAEQNRGGTIVGMDAEYACQIIVYLREQETGVDLDVISRRTQGGNLGPHMRRFSRCEFVSIAGTEDEPPPDWLGRDISGD